MAKIHLYKIALLGIVTFSAGPSWSAETESFSAVRGEKLWQQPFKGAAPFSQRSCTSCHGKNLSASGKHVVTQKIIQPMAPSVNASRLTDERKVAKWLVRNCKWTIGRVCTSQEKGDLITYLKSQ
jgi:hypothetical protein